MLMGAPLEALEGPGWRQILLENMYAVAESPQLHDTQYQSDQSP